MTHLSSRNTTKSHDAKK